MKKKNGGTEKLITYSCQEIELGLKSRSLSPESALSHSNMLPFQRTYKLLACSIYFSHPFVYCLSPSSGMLALLGKGCFNVSVTAVFPELRTDSNT